MDALCPQLDLTYDSFLEISPSPLKSMGDYGMWGDSIILYGFNSPRIDVVPVPSSSTQRRQNQVPGVYRSDGRTSLDQWRTDNLASKLVEVIFDKKVAAYAKVGCDTVSRNILRINCWQHDVDHKRRDLRDRQCLIGSSLYSNEQYWYSCHLVLATLTHCTIAIVTNAYKMIIQLVRKWVSPALN